MIRCFLGQLAIAAGEAAVARKELRNGFDGCRAAGFWPVAIWNLAWLAVAELSPDDPTTALRTADEALTMANEIDFALGRGLAYRARGLALAASKRPDEAAVAFTAALDTFLDIGAAYDAALSRLDLTRAFAQQESRDTGAAHLTAAVSAFSEMGVDLDAVGACHVSHMLGAEIPTSRG